MSLLDTYDTFNFMLMLVFLYLFLFTFIIIIINNVKKRRLNNQYNPPDSDNSDNSNQTKSTLQQCNPKTEGGFFSWLGF